MLNSISIALMLVILVLTLFQPNRQRFSVALIYSGMIMMHYTMLVPSSGLLYFVSAGLFNVVVVFSIAWVTPLSLLCLRLMCVCVVGVLLNLFGFLLWYYYIDLAMYAVLFIFLDILAIVFLLDRREQTEIKYPFLMQFNRAKNV